MECLSPYLCMVTVPHIMVGLERMLDYRGVGLARFHCTHKHRLSVCRYTVCCYLILLSTTLYLLELTIVNDSKTVTHKRIIPIYVYGIPKRSHTCPFLSYVRMYWHV